MSIATTGSVSIESIPLVHPRLSRMRAAEKARMTPHLCKAVPHFVLTPDGQNVTEIVLDIPTATRHGLADTLGRILHVPWHRQYPTQVKHTTICLEDLRVNRRDGFAVRIIRRGQPTAEVPERYDFAEFTFCLPHCPVQVHLGERENPSEEYPGIVLVPSLLADFCRAIDRCTVIFEKHPINVAGFYHGGRAYRIGRVNRENNYEEVLL